MIKWLKSIMYCVVITYNEALEEVREKDRKGEDSTNHTSTFSSNNYGGGDGD